jgi:hypothetical protein
VTDVRELLESAAAAGPEPAPDEVPVEAVLAAGRRQVRRRRLVVGGAGAAAAVAVLAVAVPLSTGSSGGRLPDGVSGLSGGGGHATVAPAALPTGTGATTCGPVRFDKAQLPGRTVTVDGDWPTARAADLLSLHGWPRAVPFDVGRWTQITDGKAGVLVASLPGAGYRYLPVQRGAGGEWVVGPPCTPR